MPCDRIRDSMKRWLPIFLVPLSLLSCTADDSIPLKVELGTRAVSKLAFVIAEDQGLYDKYGLDVDLRMPPPEFDGGIYTHDKGMVGRVWNRFWERVGVSDPWKADVFVDGLTPNIVKRIDRARFPHYVAVAATDCILRAHIVGGPEIRTFEDLKGKRLGISGRRDTTTGFAALTAAKRMGWDPVLDVSIKLNGRDVPALKEGLVDAIVASEVRYAVAMKEGYNIVADTKDWDVAVAGNSAMVSREWLDDPSNHEAIRRLVKALSEALFLFHTDRELSIDVLRRWHGIDDRQLAEIIYDRGQWMPVKPYPCYEGTKNTFELYDSNEMRRYSPSDFYDDTFIRELDESGFIDRLYEKEK